MNLKPVQKRFPSLGKRETTERCCNAFQRVIRCSSDSGVVCQIVFDAWPVKKCLPDVKRFMCTLCAWFMNLQDLSFKDNNCQIYKSEVSRTKRWEFSKRNIHKATFLWYRCTIGCKLDRVCEYMYTGVAVLFLQTRQYCHDCCMVHQILVYFVITSGDLF